MEQSPFNTVVVSLNGAVRRLSLDDFLALPLNERVRYILFGQLQFFLGAARVEPDLALDYLRRFRSG